MKKAPFNAAELIDQLRPFDWQGAMRPTGAERAYRRYYGTDFAELDLGDSRLGTLSGAGYRLALQYWAPKAPKGTVFLLHGYYDHQGLYRHIIRFFLQQGWAVLGFDLPGHGLSSGARALIGDFSEYQAALQAVLKGAVNLPKPWLGFGQSTGGAIWVDYLTATGGEAFSQVMLFSPLVRPIKWRRGRASYYLARPFMRHVGRRFSKNSQDPAFLEFLRWHDPLQARALPVAWIGALNRWIKEIERRDPVAFSPLIVQGTEDHTVDWQYNLPVLQRLFNRPKIKLLADARHHLANEITPVRAEYFDWLKSSLSLGD